MTDEKGNFDDRSYVATAFKGVQQVTTDFGWKAITAEPRTPTKEDYRKELASLMDQGCDLIVALSSVFGQVTVEVAAANPMQKFQTLELAPDPALPNVWGQVYAASEPCFLAGYVAAGTTRTGKVGTFGGLDVQPITEWLDGFALGVRHYNTVHGTSVEVVGWDVEGQVGAFTGTFTDVAKGQEITDELLAQGADIILPVAGGASYGAGDAVIIKGDAYVIGVDLDWAEQEAYAGVTLTSIIKKIDENIVSAVKSVIDGSFSGGRRLATLENGEVDLAPFHQLESLVPAEVKAELPGIRAQIIDGTLKTTP